MKKKEFIRGNEYLYIPFITDLKDVGVKLYYCFSRDIIQFDGVKTTQYIFAKDKKTLNKYKSVKSYERAMQKNSFIGFNNYVIDDNPIYFKDYSNKLENTIISFYNYLSEKENTYKKAKAFSRFYSDGNESLFYSKVFFYLRKHYSLYKIKLNSIILFYCFIGVLKLPIYIIIFIKDILISSISAYKNYKLKESSAKFYDDENWLKRTMLNVTEEDFKKEKEKAYEELDKVKNNYINSNISLFTLIIALVTLVFTVIINTKNNIKTQSDLRACDSLINEVQNENQDLREKIQLLNSEIKYESLFQQIIDLNSNLKVNTDENSMKIESLEKELIEKKKN